MDNAGKPILENPSEMYLRKDSEWALIDKQPCRVIGFTAFASINNGRVENAGLSMPYCVVQMECKKLPGIVRGYITHKIDFTNLWRVFKERGVAANEEVIIFWTRTNYKSRFTKLLSSSMPKLIVHICHKHAYEVLTDPGRMGLTGQAWANAISSIEELKPDVMK